MSYLFTSQLEAIENIKNQLNQAIEDTENELKQVHIERNELLIFTKFRNANLDMFEPVDMVAYESNLATLAQKVKVLTEKLELQQVSKVRFNDFVQEQYKHTSEIHQGITDASTV